MENAQVNTVDCTHHHIKSIHLNSNFYWNCSAFKSSEHILMEFRITFDDYEFLISCVFECTMRRMLEAKK